MATKPFLSEPSGPSRRPAELETFHAEQRRQRRWARLWTWLWRLVVLVTGLPMSAVLTPALFLVAVLAARLADSVATVPETVWRDLHESAALVPSAIDALFGPAPFRLGTALLSILLAVPTLFPGLVAMAILAWRLQTVLVRSGPAILSSRLQARDPAPGREQELEDLLAGIADRAGVARPTLSLLDVDYPNAAALQGHGATGSLFVTRGLVSSFDDVERRAVACYLTTALGNGDARLGLVATGILQAFGVVLTALDAVLNLSRSAWNDLRLVGVALLLGRTPSPADSARLFELNRPRGDGLTEILLDTRRPEPRTRGARLLRRTPLLWLLSPPLFLLVFALLLVRGGLGILRLFLVEPLVMVPWRSRRYRTDSLAVALSGDPDGLARALLELNQNGTAPGGATFSDLFMVGTEAVTLRAQAGLQEAQAAARREAEGAPWQKLTANLEAQRRASREYLDAIAAAEAETPGWRIFEPRPPLSRRLEHLQELGASVRSPDAGARARRRRWLVALVLLPLALLATPFVAGAVALTLLLGGGAAMLVAGGGMRLIELALL